MHNSAENDLARSFLNVNPNPQLLSNCEDQGINVDTFVYDEIDDVCFKIFCVSSNDHSMESSSSDEVPNISDGDDLKNALPKRMVTDLCSVPSSETSDKECNDDSNDEFSDFDQSSTDDIASLADEGSMSGSLPTGDDLSSGNEADVEEGYGALLSHEKAHVTDFVSVNVDQSSDDEEDDVEVEHRLQKKRRNEWSIPVATFNCWKTALKRGYVMEGCDWKAGHQRGARKHMFCVTHVNCGREMKIIFNKHNSMAEIYMCGSHSSTISMLPFEGKGTLELIQN